MQTSAGCPWKPRPWGGGGPGFKGCLVPHEGLQSPCPCPDAWEVPFLEESPPLHVDSHNPP